MPVGRDCHSKITFPKELWAPPALPSHLTTLTPPCRPHNCMRPCAEGKPPGPQRALHLPRPRPTSAGERLALSGLSPKLETCKGRVPHGLSSPSSARGGGELPWISPHRACHHLCPLGHVPYPLPDFLLLFSLTTANRPRACGRVESCLLTAGAREPAINTSVILSKMPSQERLRAGLLSPVSAPPLLCVGPMEAYHGGGPVVRPHAFE